MKDKQKKIFVALFEIMYNNMYEFNDNSKENPHLESHQNVREKTKILGENPRVFHTILTDLEKMNFHLQILHLRQAVRSRLSSIP